jgi:alkyl hydroperoxide reductase subunit AhpC
MMELGELESNHEEFEKRGVRVFVISNDDQKTSQLTQADFPHLTVIADTKQTLAKHARMLHPHAGPNDTSTNVPTILLLDGKGTMRYMYRSPQVIERLSPKQVLDAVDEHLVKKS